MAEEYKNNHYVPVWYQKRFVVDSKTDHKLFYLNLKPPEFFDSKGGMHIGKDLGHKGFDSCFCEEDLYTTNFYNIESKRIEKFFFGDIDAKGRNAVDWCGKFSHPWDGSDSFNELLLYMSTQKLRTPKGLDWLGNQIQKEGLHNKDVVLLKMMQIRQIYCALWMECVWQIVDASKSDTKFIISDHPVTVYNRRCDPKSYKCRTYNDPDIRLHATHTIFPLSLNKALILTNLSWIRNPYQNELRLRPNPTFFRDAMMKITEIQTERYLSEDEVRQINYIVKNRAYNYIAAAKKDWLYPEKYISGSEWSCFGHGYLLMPDPRGVSYTTHIMIGHKDGTVSGFDEYGRLPWQKGFRDSNDSGVNNDWHTFHCFQGEFARLFGPYRRGRSFDHVNLDNECDSDEFHKYHLGLENEFTKKMR